MGPSFSWRPTFCSFLSSFSISPRPFRPSSQLKTPPTTKCCSDFSERFQARLDASICFCPIRIILNVFKIIREKEYLCLGRSNITFIQCHSLEWGLRSDIYSEDLCLLFLGIQDVKILFQWANVTLPCSASTSRRSSCSWIWLSSTRATPTRTHSSKLSSGWTTTRFLCYLYQWKGLFKIASSLRSVWRFTALSITQVQDL